MLLRYIPTDDHNYNIATVTVYRRMRSVQNKFEA